MVRRIEEIMKDYPYLIKFQKELSHAANLIEMGELYMQSVEVYIKMENESHKRGQGDCREAVMFDFVRVGVEHPTYCMYAVPSKDLQGNRIFFEKRMLDAFCPAGGWMVVIKTQEFIKQYKEKRGQGVDHMGLVKYHTRSFEEDKILFKEGILPHFFKDPDFSYQNEFRIVMSDSLEREDIPFEETPLLDEYFKEKNIHCKRYKPKAYYIESIEEISELYSTNEIIMNEKECYLQNADL